MIILKSYDVKAFSDIRYPIVEATYQVHLPVDTVVCGNSIEEEICKSMFMNVYGLSIEDIKEMFPEKFI